MSKYGSPAEVFASISIHRYTHQNAIGPSATYASFATCSTQGLGVHGPTVSSKNPKPQGLNPGVFSLFWLRFHSFPSFSVPHHERNSLLPWPTLHPLSGMAGPNRAGDWPAVGICLLARVFAWQSARNRQLPTHFLGRTAGKSDVGATFGRIPQSQGK